MPHALVNCSALLQQLAGGHTVAPPIRVLQLYRVGEMLQFTGRGVGMVCPFVHFQCRPQAAVLTLRASGSE